MNPRILLYVALVLAVVNLVHRAEPPQQLPLVKADYTACIPVNTGPIERPDHYSTNPRGRRKDIA